MGSHVQISKRNRIDAGWWLLDGYLARQRVHLGYGDVRVVEDGLRRSKGEAFNSVSVAVISTSLARLHARPMGMYRTCRWVDEIKKSTH